MQRRTLTIAMGVASMIYGLIIAVLAINDSDATGLVAIIGGVLLGIGWVLIGVLGRGTRGTSR